MKNDEIANLKDSIENTRRIMIYSEMLLSALAGKLEAAEAEAVEAVRQLETAVDTAIKLRRVTERTAACRSMLEHIQRVIDQPEITNGQWDDISGIQEKLKYLKEKHD